MDFNDITHFLPPPVKIVLADDSDVVRRLLQLVFSTDPEIEICVAATNGREAVVQAARLMPDIILLDIEMPVMDGIEATVAIRKRDPRVPIIMFCTSAGGGDQATLDALTHGATDFVLKPSIRGHVNESIEYIRSELLPKIKRWGRWSQRIRHLQTIKAMPAARSLEISSRKQAPNDSQTDCHLEMIDVAGIGISTGGPNALAQILKEIPADFPVPILITQHMPADFTRLLAERLQRICPLKVREGATGATIAKGSVWIAPGDHHMVLKKAGPSVQIHLNRNPPENSCRPSVDVMFRSIAEVYGNRSVAVIMTGMGQDGLQGCRAIADRGGRIVAQDEASSVVWGMPRSVVVAGLANRVLALNDIAAELRRSAAVGRALTLGVQSAAG